LPDRASIKVFPDRTGKREGSAVPAGNGPGPTSLAGEGRGPASPAGEGADTTLPSGEGPGPASPAGEGPDGDPDPVPPSEAGPGEGADPVSPGEGADPVPPPCKPARPDGRGDGRAGPSVFAAEKRPRPGQLQIPISSNSSSINRSQRRLSLFQSTGISLSSSVSIATQAAPPSGRDTWESFSAQGLLYWRLSIMN